MKKIILTIACFFSALAIPFIALAHPGHGETDGYTIIHYFTEPTHAILTVGVMVAAIVLIRYERKKNAQNKN